MLIIRLQRVGKKKFPTYRLIISEKTKDTWGNYLEELGSFNPHSKENQLVAKADRIKFWLSKGAQMSDTINNLLLANNIIEGKKKKSVYLSQKRQTKITEKNKAKVDAEAKAKEDAAAKAAAEQTAKAEAEEAAKAATAVEAEKVVEAPAAVVEAPAEAVEATVAEAPKAEEPAPVEEKPADPAQTA